MADREVATSRAAGPLVPNICISSADLGCRAAYETWLESVADVFDAKPDSRDGIGRFPIEMNVFHPGPLVLGQFVSPPQVFERSPRSIANGGLDHFLIQLYESGGFAGAAGGADIRVRAGDICIFDLTRTLDTRASDFRNVTLIVPRPLLETFVEDVDALSGIVLAGEEPLTRMLARHMRSLHGEMAQMAQDEAEAAARATVALIAVAAQRHAGFGTTGSKPLVSRFRAIVAHIDANLHDETLSPNSICADLGMSRATLYRLFEPVGGVAEFIRIRRLEAAMRLLVAPQACAVSIAEIAFGCGFKSLSSFSKAFRSHFGLSAREVRQNAGGKDSVRLRSPGLAEEAELSYWLKTLA